MKRREKKEKKTPIKVGYKEARKLLVRLAEQMYEKSEEDKDKCCDWIKNNCPANDCANVSRTSMVNFTGLTKSVFNSLFDVVRIKKSKNFHTFRNSTKQQFELILCNGDDLGQWLAGGHPKHLFFDTRWIVYYPSRHPEERRGVIVLSEFTFTIEGNITVSNPKAEEGEGRWLNDYSGTILKNSSESELHLALQIIDENGAQEMHTTMYIMLITGNVNSKGNMPKILLGNFMRRDIKSAISSGSVIFERVEAFKDHKQRSWISSHYENNEEDLKSNRKILDYFYFRPSSYTRTPTTIILDPIGIQDEAEKWATQRFKRDPRYFDVYISTPIGIDIPEKKRKALLKGIELLKGLFESDIIDIYPHMGKRITPEDSKKTRYKYSTPFERLNDYQRV